MADFYLFTPVRTRNDMTDSPDPQHGLRFLVPLVGLALTGCAWPMAGDASRPELNSQAWVEQRYERAKGMLAEGHYGLALENFRDMLRHDSYSVRALNGLAAAYDKLGRYDLAQRYYKKALVVEPTSFQTLNNIGYSYMLAGKYAEAREFLGKAAEIDANNATVVANLKQLVEKEVAALSEKNAAKAFRAENVSAGDSAGEAENARRMWVERSSAAVQVLITRPDSDLVEWANSNGIEPRWVHIEKREDASPANRITVLTERYPVVKAAAGPSQTATAPQTSDPAAGPTMTAVASPAVSGPESLSTPKAGAGDATAGVVQTPAPVTSTDKTSASAAPEPVPNSAAAAADDTAKAPETKTEAPPVSVAAAPAPASSPGDAAGTGETAKAPETPAENPPATTAGVAERPAPADADNGTAGPNANAKPGMDGISGDTPQRRVEERPAMADRGDGKPLDLTPPPAATSASGAPVQSAGVPSATDASEPKADVKTNWIESPWQDPRTQDAAPKPVTESGPESSNPLQQVAGGQKSLSDSDQQTTPPANADAVATATDSESDKQPKGSDQLAALAPVEPDFSGHGPRQDGDMPRVLEISNGAGRLAMAARMEEHFKSLNIPLVNLTNAISFTNEKTVLYFKPGFEGAAMRVSLLLPLRPELRSNPALVPDLRLVLGGDMLDFDRQLIARKFVADSTR
jgi:Tfp pilus assembly protein PilF